MPPINKTPNSMAHPVTKNADAPDTGTKKSGLTSRTLANLSWQSAAIVNRSIIQVGVTAVLARLLEPSDFGLVATANIAIGLTSIFAQFGFGQAVVQQAKLTDRHIRTAFTISLLSSFALTALLSLLAPLIAQGLDAPEVTDVLRILSLSFVISGLGAIAEFLLIRDLNFKSLFRINVLAFLGYGLAAIPLAAMGFGVWSIVYAHLFRDLLKTVSLLISRPHAWMPLISRHEAASLARFGGGVTLGSFFTFLSNNGDYVVVSRWIGPTALGIYQQAFNIMLLPVKFLGDMLDRVLFATVSDIRSEPERVSRSFSRSAMVVNAVLLPVSLGMIVLSPEIVDILLGPKWAGAVRPLQILLVAAAFRATARIADSYCRALGAVYRVALIQGVYAATLIGMCWLAHPWGITGVAAAATLATLANHIAFMRLALSQLSLTSAEYLKMMTPGVVIGLLVFLISSGLAFFCRQWNQLAIIVAAVTTLGTFLATAGLLHLFSHWLPPELTELMQQFMNIYRSKIAVATNQPAGSSTR